MIDEKEGSQPITDVKSSFDASGDNLLSLAAHELRTTLSIIKWYTEMLLDGDCGPLSSDQVKYLKTIETSNQRAIDLIKSLLNVSRLNLGTFCIIPTEVDLRFIVKQVLDQYKLQIEQKRLHVNETYEGAVPGMISTLNADKQICLVILRALISNAVIFSKDEGNIQIKIQEAHQYDQIGEKKLTEDCLLVSVSDGGIGIPENEQDKVFSRLFKASNAKDSGAEGGTGFGLYVVKSVLEKIGGEIWFESKKDNGSTFYVTFPKFGMAKKEGRTSLD